MRGVRELRFCRISRIRRIYRYAWKVIAGGRLLRTTADGDAIGGGSLKCVPVSRHLWAFSTFPDKIPISSW